MGQKLHRKCDELSEVFVQVSRYTLSMDDLLGLTDESVVSPQV